MHGLNLERFSFLPNVFYRQVLPLLSHEYSFSWELGVFQFSQLRTLLEQKTRVIEQVREKRRHRLIPPLINEM